MKSKSLFKIPGARATPKISWTQLTGFKKEDFRLRLKPKKRRRMTIKRIIKSA